MVLERVIDNGWMEMEMVPLRSAWVAYVVTELLNLAKNHHIVMETFDDDQK